MQSISLQKNPFLRLLGFVVVTSTLLLALSALHAADSEFPRELVDFKPYEGNPIFAGQGEGHWDALIRERGWILRDGGLYHLWYTGYDSRPMKLGYATSKDGLKWTRYPENPIYTDHWVEDMIVVKQAGTFYMFAEGLDDQAHLLTSQDGIRWERQGVLDVRYTNGKRISPGPFGTPTAWFEDGKWYLLYERRDEALWLAVSTDLKVWTHVQDEPVLRPGPNDYDRDLIAANQVVQHKGRYFLYYHGLGKGNKGWTTNAAVSDDRIHWKKYAGNPLFPAEANKSSGILVRDGHGARLYTMHGQVHVHFSQDVPKLKSLERR